MRALLAGLLGLALATPLCAQPASATRPAGPPFAGAIAAFAEQDAAHPPPACPIVFVGSSSIRRWDSLTHDMAPLTVINRGFGGAEIDHVNAYFQQTVGRYKPRAIVFYAGENDIAAGDSAEKAFADFQEFLRLKSSALGDTPVYALSAKPAPSRLKFIPEQTRFNEMVRGLADQRADLVYLDIVPAMTRPDGGLKEIFAEDQLHMTAEGYGLWTPIVKGALSRPPPTRAPGC